MRGSCAPLRRCCVLYGLTSLYGVCRYKDNVIARVCEAVWPPSAVVGLAKTLRDIPMSASRLKDVVTKVLAQIGMLPVEELPSLVYQLLLLSARGAWRVVRGARCVWWFTVELAGHRLDVLRGVMREFDQLDADLPTDGSAGAGNDSGSGVGSTSRTGDQLRRVEGTVITHFNFAAKQDLGLARDMVRLLCSACGVCGSRQQLW